MGDLVQRGPLIPDIPENAKLINRLYNWKFGQAWYHAEAMNLPDEVTHLISTLNRMFGNIGWVMDGDMTVLIQATVAVLIGFEEDS